MTRPTHLLAVTVLAFAAAPAPTPGPPPTYDFTRPRDLPSMVKRWESAGASCSVVVRDGAAYILRQDGVEARRAIDGRVLWTAKVPTGECPYHWQRPLQVAGDRLVAGHRDKVFALSRATGAVAWTLPLDGALYDLASAPVAVVVGRPNAPPDLLSVDLDTGAVRARRTLPGSVSDLVSASGTIVAVWSENNASTAHGLSPRDLSEVWTSTVYTGVQEEDGLVYGTAPDEDCDCETRFSVLDAATGMPSERRPHRHAPDDSRETKDVTWDLQSVGPGPIFDLRRSRREDGMPLWTVPVPGVLDTWATQGDSLFVHVRPAGRGFLLELDWNTGALRRAAYALRQVYEMAATGDVVVLAGEDGVTAVAAREAGPSEASLFPVADEVRRILTGRLDYWELGTPIRELQVLGPEALPVVTGLIPSLDRLPLQVAAPLVGAARYRAAAPVLAARLGSAPPEEMPYASTRGVILDALAPIAGDAEVPAIAALLRDATVPSHVRFAAFTTLASLGTPAAVAALEGAVSAPAAPAPWWDPPDPAPLLPHLARGVESEEIQRRMNANEWESLDTLVRARSAARAPAADGGSFVVFPDSQLGGAHDLWLAELDATGRPRGRAVFLGVSSPGYFAFDGAPIGVRVEGTRVEVRRTAGGHEVVSADLAEAARDRDRDGIPDLVERRLLLDPERADSDGDGIPDASDPVPNAAATAEDDLAPVAAAFFEQYFGVYAPGEDRGAIIVISDRALARYGRRGPTLVLTGKQAERLTQQAEKARMPLPPRLSLEPEGAPSTAGRAMPVDAFTTRGAAGGRAGADERALRFTHYVAPLNAAGYQVVMRKIGKRWYVRSFVQRWVS